MGRGAKSKNERRKILFRERRTGAKEKGKETTRGGKKGRREREREHTLNKRINPPVARRER